MLLYIATLQELHSSLDDILCFGHALKQDQFLRLVAETSGSVYMHSLRAGFYFLSSLSSSFDLNDFPLI